MSDLMLTAVLSMPYEMAMENEWSRRQFWDRAQQALAQIERLTAALQHEADCVEAAKEEIERLTAECDELRRQLAEAWAQREAMANVLPGYYYMDPPDGGDVSVLEQLRRMAKDAQRYRWLRANREFCVATYPEGEWVIPAGMVFLGYSNPDADSWIDAAMGGGNE